MTITREVGHYTPPHPSSIQHHLSSMSLLQPIDRDIIANFKRQHRSLVLGHLLMGVIETTAGRTAELAARKTDAAGLTCRSTRGVGLQCGPLSADTGVRVSGKEMSEATVCCGGGQRAIGDRLV